MWKTSEGHEDVIYKFKKQSFAAVAQNKLEEASKSLPKRIERGVSAE